MSEPPASAASIQIESNLKALYFDRNIKSDPSADVHLIAQGFWSGDLRISLAGRFYFRLYWSHAMENQKLILLAEAQMLPQHRDRVLSAAKASLPLTLAEAGCESFYLTFSAEDPNKIGFFEMFSSEEAHTFHLEQEHPKRILASIEGGSPRHQNSPG